VEGAEFEVDNENGKSGEGRDHGRDRGRVFDDVDFLVGDGGHWGFSLILNNWS